ncbi:MAG: YfhO family protein [Gemmiger sp.]
MTDTIQPSAAKKRGGAMNRWAKRRPNTALVLAYTVVFALLMGLWLAVFAASGKSLIQYGDTLKQHYAALMYYGRWLRQAARCLLTGTAIPTWDSTIGYGSDVITTLSYYVIGDPLNLTAAFVPSRYTEQLLEALIVVRIYLAGLAFLPFSLRHGNSRFGTLLGAVAYAFCGWTIQVAAIEPIFLVPMYCFPLVLLGADDLLEGRRPTLYIAAIALAALSNFLFFYMIAVLLVLYAAVRYFQRYGVRRLRTLWPLLGRFVLYSLVGIAIAAVTLLPTAIEMFGGARFSLDRQTTEYPFARTFQLLANLTTGAGFDTYSTYIGISAVAFLAVLVLFARRKKDAVLKFAWLGMLAMMLLPWAGRVLNGFSYVQNRWVWAFAMLEAFILARVCPDMTCLAAGEKRTLWALLAGYCVLAFWNADARTEAALLGVALLLLLAVFVMCAGSDSPRAVRTVLLAGCCLGIVANVGYYYGADEGNALAEYKDTDAAWRLTVEANPANVLKQVEDEGYWRYDSAMGDYINSAMLMDLHGTGYFWSLNNGYLSRLFSELGENSPVEYDYKGLHNRSALEALFGVRYYLCAPDSTGVLPAAFDRQETLAMDVGGTTCAVYANRAALPIGFTLEGRMTREEYDALSPVQRQDALLNAVLTEDGDSALPLCGAQSTVVQAAAQITLNGVEQTADGTYYSPRDGGTITLTVENPAENCESYLVVQGMQYTATNPYDAMRTDELNAMSKYDRRRLQKQYSHFWCKESVYLRLISDVGEGRIDYAMPNNQYYCGRHDFACNFGHTETGLSTVTIVLPFAGYYHFDSLTVEYQPVDGLQGRAAALSQESLQNVNLGINCISGTIRVNSDKLLVVQVPYSSGWSATVDGQPARVLRVDTAFLGLELTPGEHTVELRYQTPGLGAGMALSAAGLVAFAAITLAGRRKKRTQSHKNLLQAARNTL